MENKTSPYWDNDNGSIWYQNNSDQNNTFYDMPGRDQNVNSQWRALLTLYQGNTALFSLYYGFNVVNGKSILFPLGVVKK